MTHSTTGTIDNAYMSYIGDIQAKHVKLSEDSLAVLSALSNDIESQMRMLIYRVRLFYINIRQALKNKNKHT